MVGILAGGILGPLLTVSLAIVVGLAGVTIDPLTPWAEIVWSGVFALTFAAAGAWAVARWLPHDFQAATETYLWLAVRAEAHWHELFGDAAVPRSRSAMRAFIAATPETPETAGERFGIWMALGDLDVRTAGGRTDAGRHGLGAPRAGERRVAGRFRGRVPE